MLSVVPRLQLKRPSFRLDTSTEAGVRGGTIAITVAAFVYILRFATNSPVVDEWDLTHVLLGGMTLTEWTFTRLNEHMFIPANAAFFLLHKFSGFDFRAGMLANLIVLIAASLLLQRSANQLRGRASLADLVFPAALLHFGHAYNALMSFQLAFGFFVLSIAMLLNVIVNAEAGNEKRTATRASLVLLVVMLNGGMGIAFVPVIGLWIFVLAWRSHSILPIALLGIAVTYTAFALLGLPKVAAAPNESLSLVRIAWCVLQYLGAGTGLWYDGPHWPRNGILIAVGYAVITVLLGIATLKRSDGGLSAGLLAVLLGHFAVALGIAVSRGGGIAERYVTISAIGIVITFLAVIHLRFKLTVELGIGLGMTVLLIAANAGPGLDYGHRHRNLDRSFRKDMAEGMPIGFLKDKYAVLLRVGDNLDPALERLRTHGIRDYSQAVPTPVMRQVSIADAAFDIPLADSGKHVCGLGIEFEIVTPLPWCEVKLQWESSNGPRTATVYPPRSPGRHWVRIWVDDVPRNAKLIEVQRSQVLKIQAAEWLIPVAAQTH